MYKKSSIPTLLLIQLPINAPIKPSIMLVKHPFEDEPASPAPIEPQIDAIKSKINNLIILYPEQDDNITK